MRRNIYVTRRITLITTFIILLIIGSDYVFHGGIRATVWRIGGGAVGALTRHSAGIAKFVDAIVDAPVLADVNLRLKIENNELRGAKAEAAALALENESLRDQLHVAMRTKRELLPVTIAAFQSDAVSATLTINCGLRDGVTRGMTVIAGGNIVVGIVTETLTNTAYVKLVYDPRTRIGVRVGSQTLAYAQGDLHSGLQLELVTASDPIIVGDSVVTSGIDDLPDGLVVGTVETAAVTPGGLFQKATVRSAFDPALGSTLFVILNQ